MNLEKYYPVNLPEIRDGIDGRLSVAEGLHNIPFEIKRVYFIYDLENPRAVRGKHAHKQLEQVLFCVHGSFLLGLDDGYHKENILVKEGNSGVYIGPGLWHTMTKFSKGCVLLVLASEYYKESDYIRDYEEFIIYSHINQYDSIQ